MITETMTPREEIDFQTLYAAVFMFSVVGDYTTLLKVMFDERGDKYARNKADDVDKAVNKLQNLLSKQLFGKMNAQQQEIAKNAVEEHREIIYSLFAMDSPERNRIKNLITKIKRERS